MIIWNLNSYFFSFRSCNRLYGKIAIYFFYSALDSWLFNVPLITISNKCCQQTIKTFCKHAKTVCVKDCKYLETHLLDWQFTCCYCLINFLLLSDILQNNIMYELSLYYFLSQHSITCKISLNYIYTKKNKTNRCIYLLC